MNKKEWSIEDIMDQIDLYDDEAQKIIREHTLDDIFEKIPFPSYD